MLLKYCTLPSAQEVVASSSDITGYQATVYGLTGFTQVCWAG